jgi:hypothetical protein
LAAGTYRIKASAPAYKCESTQVRLYNYSDSASVIIGHSRLATADNGAPDVLCSVAGEFTIASSKTFELQHRCGTTQSSNGFGRATSWGTEVYSEVILEKVA